MNNKTSEWYEKRRNELVSMLDEALALDIPETYNEELRSTAKKCKENSFEIALVGEFQGGKSTTFNALCDGRDISPRGLGGGGIKTSAAAISVQNISGDETKDGLSEWAEVTFKQPVALVLGMASVLRPILVADNEFELTKDEDIKEKLYSDSEFCRLVKIDDISHRAALQRAVDSLWSKWEKNKCALDDEELDQLRIATLQLKFYGTPEYKQMIQKTTLPVFDFQKLVAFPRDWIVRWLNGKNADFKLEEIAFVFIESVLVRLHSQNLGRVGCRITDCPGLFANSYDTAVAKRVIQNSDAIWYLIGGDKQIGEKDLEILKTIKNMGMLEKTDATCNLKGSHEQKISEVIPVTKAVLESKDYNLDLVPYNARLAFLSMQGNLLLNDRNNFSEYDLANMRIDAKDKTGEAKPEEMWCTMINRLGVLTELESLEKIHDLNSTTIRDVRKESYFDDIIEKLEGEVISKKAHSILIDKGSRRAAAALQNYEGLLQTQEDAASAKEEEWKARVNEAEKKLRDFVDSAKQIAANSYLIASKEPLAKTLAEEFIDKVIDDYFISDISLGISKILRKTAAKFYSSNGAMIEAVKSEMTPFLETAFKDAITNTRERVNGFDSFKDLKKNCRKISKSIQRLWEDKCLNVEDLFHGIEIPEIELDFSFGNDLLDDNIFTENSVVSDIAEDLRIGIFSGIFYLIGSLISLPAKGIRKLGEWLGICDEETEGERESNLLSEARELIPKVRPELEKAINNVKFRRAIEKPLNKCFLEFMEKVSHNFDCALSSLESDFRNARCKPVEESFTKVQADRQKIADDANRIRTTQIRPLRERINAFEKAVEVELA